MAAHVAARAGRVDLHCVDVLRALRGLLFGFAMVWGFGFIIIVTSSIYFRMIIVLITIIIIKSIYCIIMIFWGFGQGSFVGLWGLLRLGVMGSRPRCRSQLGASFRSRDICSLNSGPF